MDTLFDYLGSTPVALEPLADDAAHERIAQIVEYYEARQNAPQGVGRRAVQAAAAGRLYLTESEWKQRLVARRLRG